MEAAKTHNRVHPNPTKVSFSSVWLSRALEIKPSAVFLTPYCQKGKQKKQKHVGLGWAEVPPVHHTLFSEASVCMTLLCSAVISVKALDKSASPSLPFSSEKIFLQWKIQTECQVRKLARTVRKRTTLMSPNM